MDLNPFKKKKKQPQGQEGEQPVASVKADIYNSETDLAIQTRQREKGQKVDIEREPITGGITRTSSGSSADFETSARIREIMFNPTPENLEMLGVTKKQHWVALSAEQTFDDVRKAGEGRRNGSYFSVAGRFITHFDRRSISVQGNVSEARNAMLQVHQDMSSADSDSKGRQMPMG